MKADLEKWAKRGNDVHICVGKGDIEISWMLECTESIAQSWRLLLRTLLIAEYV